MGNIDNLDKITALDINCLLTTSQSTATVWRTKRLESLMFI